MTIAQREARIKDLKKNEGNPISDGVLITGAYVTGSIVEYVSSDYVHSIFSKGMGNATSQGLVKVANEHIKSRNKEEIEYHEKKIKEEKPCCPLL